MSYDPANPNNKPNPFRNLRPEMDPKNTKHRAFMLLPESYEDVRQRCLNFNALHRLAFVAAAMEVNGPFIDIRQESAADPVPYPEHGEKFTAIIGDRVTIQAPASLALTGFRTDADGPVALSLGPDAYDVSSMRRLFAQADLVTVDCTGTGTALVYMGACAPTAMHGKNCILIETTVDLAPAWAHFVNEVAGSAAKVLVDDETVAAYLQRGDADPKTLN